MNDDLLAWVRAVFQEVDPMPVEVLAAGRAAIAWRLPGVELAESALGPSRPVHGVRGAGDRGFTFSASRLVIEIEIERDGRAWAIAGKLAPPVPARVRVRHPALVPEQPEAQADLDGHFALPALPEGLVSLAFLLPDGTSVVTSWIRL